MTVYDMKYTKYSRYNKLTDEIKTPTDDTPELPTYDGPQITIEEEMKTSYLDYAMSVIVSRAIPDLRD